MRNTINIMDLRDDFIAEGRFLGLDTRRTIKTNSDYRIIKGFRLPFLCSIFYTL